MRRAGHHISVERGGLFGGEVHVADDDQPVAEFRQVRSRPIDPHQLVILNKRSEVKNLFVRCRQ